MQYICKVNKAQNKKQNKMLSKSIEERAINLIIKGIDPIEAVKQAIIEENNFISEMIEQRTERSKKAHAQLCKNVYGLIHLIH
jgi:hypothetical protein